MSKPLTEDAVDAIIASVAHKVVRRAFRDVAVAKVAESLAAMSPERLAHMTHDAKALASSVEAMLIAGAATWHYGLRGGFGPEKVKFSDELARARKAGFVP